MIELVVFLGNPGKEYSRNRHNAGFLLAEKLKIDLSWGKKYKGYYAVLDRNQLEEKPVTLAEGGLSSRLHFIKPQNYMNLSGQSVSAVASFFKIGPPAILVVHDELELPLGTLSLKFGGGLGGHNGLRSVKASLGSADFWRLRIGIGRPDNRRPGEGGPEGSGKGIVDWVLSDFSAKEAEEMELILQAASVLIMEILLCGPESRLPEWAKKKVLLDA